VPKKKQQQRTKGEKRGEKADDDSGSDGSRAASIAPSAVSRGSVGSAKSYGGGRVYSADGRVRQNSSIASKFGGSSNSIAAAHLARARGQEGGPPSTGSSREGSFKSARRGSCYGSLMSRRPADRVPAPLSSGAEGGSEEEKRDQTRSER
jgi:hypothetical protein